MHRGGAVLILAVLLLIRMAVPCLAAEESIQAIPELQWNGNRIGTGGEKLETRTMETRGIIPPVLSAMGMVLSAYLIGIGYEKWHMKKRK